MNITISTGADVGTSTGAAIGVGVGVAIGAGVGVSSGPDQDNHVKLDVLNYWLNGVLTIITVMLGVLG